MRKEITIEAQPRTELGKNENRRLRASGMLPAVVYGHAADALAVAVSPKEVEAILHSSTGHNTLFNVDIPGKEKSLVMIVDWQHHPVKSHLLHVDMLRIDPEKPMMVKVPVHTEGEARGVKQQGGLLEVVTREILVECLPDYIPEHLTVDVRNLLIGQNIRAADVPLPAGVSLRDQPDSVICHVVALRVSVAAAAEEAAAEAAEPEVIKKGKKEEEE